MYTMYIIELILLVGGGLLWSRGLKVYKVMQMLLCGAVGAYIGLHIGYSIGRQELYLLALILTVVGAYIGYRYYKASLFATATLSSFLVVFSYFWKKAIVMVNEGADQIVEIKDIISSSTSGQSSIRNVGSSINNIMLLQEQNVSMIAKTAADTIRQGVIAAVITGIIVGILTLWFGDLIIMFFTSAFGALLLVYLLEIFIAINPTIHICMILGMMMVGIFLQNKYCK